MSGLYEAYNNMVNLKGGDDLRRDANYTYYPYVHSEGEFAYEDPKTGIAYYRVPNSQVGINGVIGSMADGVRDISQNIANGFNTVNGFDEYRDYFMGPERQEGLNRLAEGARNVFDRSRGYAQELMSNSPYSDVPVNNRRR